MSNTMRSQVQESESTTQGEFSWLLNSLVSNPQNQQQLQQAELSNPQNPQLQQIYDCWNSTEDESFQEIFEGLSNIYQLDNILPDKKLFLSNSDEIESNGRKTKSVGIVNTEPDPKQSEQSKRIRSTELHNKAEKISYERERRNRIKRKMKTLQELIPNCTTSDRASMLDDAVEYLKALKLQVQMMSMAREAMWQTGVQSSSTQQVPQFVPYMPMGFGMGMGLVNMCDYSAGGTGLPLPLVPVPSSSTPLTRFVNPFPPFQVPPPSFMASQAMPAATRPTTTSSTSTKVQPQQIPRDFSYAFNSANQGESSTSQCITKSAMNDNQQVPIPGEKNKVIDSRRITPQQDR